MTQKSIHTITCPHCNKDFEQEVCDSLDITDNEEGLKDIMSGNVFIKTCPHCNTTFTYDYAISCVDLKKKFMVQYAPTPELFKVIIECIESDDESIPEGLTFRVIPGGFYSFIEKVGILAAGINDVVAEVYKEILFINLRQDNIEDILFQFNYECSGYKVLVMKENDSNDYYDVDESLLSSMYEDVHNRGVLNRDKDYVVNRDFALKILYNKENLDPIHLDILAALNAEA